MNNNLIWIRLLLKWITQHVLLTSALVKSLVFAPLFNSHKSMSWPVLSLKCCCESTAENSRRERIFSTHIHFTFSRRFYPKRLTVYSGYTFIVSMCVFPGNRTHNLLRCWRNAVPLSHRNTHILFGMPEEHIIRTYHLRSHVILYLLQETRSHTTPALSKPSFLWPPVLFNVGYRGFFISFIASLCLVYCVGLSLKPLNRMFSTTLINALEWA